MCVPAILLEQAAQTLQTQEPRLQRLPDLEHPDLYHCYRRGAKNFSITGVEPPTALVLVSDEMIGIRIDEDAMTAA